MLTPLNKSLCRTITQALIILAAVFSVTSPSGAQEESRSAGDPTTERIEGVAKRSAFGVYQGYSVAKYNGWERTTQYVAMRDGVRLAVDVMLPSVDGIIADAPIPTIMILQRYGRAYIFANRDGVVTPVEGYPVVRELVKNGYALVSIGIRGTGASFGTFPGVQSANEARDAYDMVEWITKQPWSNGMVGMMGNSYRANAAMMAATSPHPALKAAFPSMIDFDNYETSRPGGILLSGPLKSWTYLTGVFDGRLSSGDDPRFPKVAPVEGEDGQTLFEQARAEHASNVDVLASSIEREYRDDYEYENVPQEDQNVLASLIEPINEGNIAIYFWSGWRDIWPKQPFLWMSNLTVPRKLTIGPWTHDADDRNPETRALLKRENERNRLETVEALRWFDYWLKGIENGIMDESPYQIAVLNDVDNWKWISVDRWPIGPKKRSTGLRLQLGNDGIQRELSATPTGKVDQEFSFDVDFSATTGPRSRWKDATSFGGFTEPDIDAIAETGLAFVSEPYEEKKLLIGHPIAELFLTSTAADADVYVYLDKISVDGETFYITEGQLRASHRKLGRAPYDTMGLPWPTHFRADVEAAPELSGKVAKLEFALLPTAVEIEPGERLRLTIAGADKDNFEVSQQSEEPTVTVFQSRRHQSTVRLPFVELDAPTE